MKAIVTALFLISIFFISCTNGSETSQETNKLALPQPAWIQDRVEAAHQRLQENQAAKLIGKSIDAHGGLQTWYANGPIYFRFNYQPQGESPARDTYQTIDTWSSKARHQMADNQSIEFGWDGKKAWKKPADAEMALNPRFWALTPYYFVGIPFVLADEGANYSTLEADTLNGQPYELVKITFDPGTGDAPDDYYIVYIHPDTYEVDAIRYVVSYPGYFPDGGHSPEKLMIYEGVQEVDGIKLAEQHQTYSWNNGEKGDLVTKISVTDVEFIPGLEQSYFEIPGEAMVIDELN